MRHLAKILLDDLEEIIVNRMAIITIATFTVGILAAVGVHVGAAPTAIAGAVVQIAGLGVVILALIFHLRRPGGPPGPPW